MNNFKLVLLLTNYPIVWMFKKNKKGIIETISKRKSLGCFKQQKEIRCSSEAIWQMIKESELQYCEPNKEWESFYDPNSSN